jgi:HAD superfamily hydrolase (TIGR01549 family)
MTLTVLLDLDDTLLINDMADFLPAYLGALGSHLQGSSPDETIRQVMAATRRMITKRDPGQTLEQTFDASFYPGVGMSKAELADTIRRFYVDKFPELQRVTRPQPGAVELVEYALAQNYPVVIATNPLFPRAATYQRLEWAGLSPERYPFKLITTYEGFHFCKPNPAYYAEMLALLGWPDQPAVMVGDNLEDDIKPAAALGLPTYYLAKDLEQSDLGLPNSRTGTIDGVIPWLEEIERGQIEINFDTPAALLAVLKSTPAALDSIVSGLTDSEWQSQLEAGGLSLVEFFCHLRDVDREINWPRLERICNEENPFLPGVVTDSWAAERRYDLQDGPDALRQFIEIRTRIINLLGSMSEQGWERKARHAIFGPTSMKEMVSFMAQHDRVHVRDIRELFPLG